MEDEPEKTCTKCREDWPATVEFFHRCKGGLHSWCKACYSEDEKQREKRQRYVARRRERVAATAA